jgi:hypothetical protein
VTGFDQKGAVAFMPQVNIRRCRAVKMMR